MKQQKRKKRPRPSKSKESTTNRGGGVVLDETEQKVLSDLMEVFASASLDEVTAAYKEADGNLDKAAGILAAVGESVVPEDQSTYTTWSSSSGNCVAESSSSSNGSDLFFGDGCDFGGNGAKVKTKPKMKKVIASAGTVSTVLSKDYVRSTPMKGSSKMKGFREENWSQEAVDFLCSMLGDESELGVAVVCDVLCQCGYNLEKVKALVCFIYIVSADQALDVLLDFGCTINNIEDSLGSSDSLNDQTSDSTSNSSEIELQDNVWFRGNPFRGLSKSPETSGSDLSSESGYFESELPQKVFESLFSMPTPKSAEHELITMNWRKVVKQMTSLGQSESGASKGGQSLPAKGEEYRVLRESAKQHWDSMKSYYHKATTAFSNGEREYASYLSEQGRLQNKMAREADEMASKDIFTARNMSIENIITIDLHGQHIKQAMRLLKLHLLFGAYVRSVRLFRVITGCGSQGVGKSKLKTSVIDLLNNEGIRYSEENRGTLLIRLSGQTDFSFLDSVSDSE